MMNGLFDCAPSVAGNWKSPRRALLSAAVNVASANGYCHRFRQLLELLHAARRLDDIQHLGHSLETAHRLDRLGDLLYLHQRDRTAVCRWLLDDCRNYFGSRLGCLLLPVARLFELALDFTDVLSRGVIPCLVNAAATSTGIASGWAFMYSRMAAVFSPLAEVRDRQLPSPDSAGRWHRGPSEVF